MRILYECEICGLTSENIDKVRKCEAQGGPMFKIGQEVEFQYSGYSKPQTCVSGTVKTVIGNGHDPRYAISHHGTPSKPPTTTYNIRQEDVRVVA